MFKGTDSLKFIDNTVTWGMHHPGCSNGAAFADLDNDGDLDIVINNINEPATIYRNNAVQQLNNHFIEVQLTGDAQNKFAIGAKVTIQQKDKIQTGYVNATKGFESASLQYIHFGTGTDSIIDKMEIIWPDGKTQTLVNVKTNQRIAVDFKNAGANLPRLMPVAARPDVKMLFTDITDSVGLLYKHQENNFNDFNVQAFIPHMVSIQGPKLAVADVNGDGLEDFFVCGAANQAGTLFQQTAAGKFVATNQQLFAADATCEDVNAIFFDADNDGDKDLYVVSGGNETEAKTASALDRLYINDGKGNFSK